MIDWVDALCRDWGRDVCNRPTGLPKQSAFMAAQTGGHGFAQDSPESMMRNADLLAVDRAWRLMESTLYTAHCVVFGKYVLRMGEKRICRAIGLDNPGQARAELHIAHGYLASKLESMRPHNVTHVTCIIAKHIV